MYKMKAVLTASENDYVKKIRAMGIPTRKTIIKDEHSLRDGMYGKKKSYRETIM